MKLQTDCTTCRPSAWSLILATLILLCNTKLGQTSETVRSLDGSGNNIEHNQWGAAQTTYLRNTVPIASDYSSSNWTGASRPSARLISNLVFKQTGSKTPKDPGAAPQITELFAYFGQFMTFDMTHATTTNQNVNIDVPSDDPWFSSSGKKSISFERTLAQWNVSGEHLDQLNNNTAFLDLETVYGNSDERGALLRKNVTGTGLDGCLLQTSSTGGLPSSSQSNTQGCPITNPHNLADNRILFTGNVRSNVLPPILALHVIFLREHNRQCALLVTDADGNAEKTGEELFQHARRLTIALWQKITMYEYFPRVIGPISKYQGYDPLVHPGIENFFGAVAFRYGHSEISTVMQRLDATLQQSGSNNNNNIQDTTFSSDDEGDNGGHLLVRESFYAPDATSGDGTSISVDADSNDDLRLQEVWKDVYGICLILLSPGMF